MTRKSGEKAPISATPARGAAEAGGDLLPLLGDEHAEDERLDGLLPIGISPLARRGPGRPVGAKNRRTDLVAQYLVDRFGDPLTASMSVAGMPLRDLVRELRMVASDCGLKLGATVMDIARYQRECRVDALPYIHAKRAPETARGDPVTPVIGIGHYEDNRVVVFGARSIEDDIEQNQSLIEVAADVSHGEVSHGESTD